jgi:hypothetical protein
MYNVLGTKKGSKCELLYIYLSLEVFLPQIVDLIIFHHSYDNFFYFRTSWLSWFSVKSHRKGSFSL